VVTHDKTVAERARFRYRLSEGVLKQEARDGSVYPEPDVSQSPASSGGAVS
jgi:hypothetical protein